jgi:epoxyqueuosine reductase
MLPESPPNLDRAAAVAAVKSKAAQLGFDLAGIAPAGRSVHAEYFSQWLAAGHAGEMRYLSDRSDERVDPNVYMPGVRSVICLAVNYYVDDDPPGPDAGRIARYARGADYHRWLKQKLYDLADWIRATYPGVRTRSGTDTVPVMEKELAVRAGLGWMGKNTCVISPKLGSWILLGEVLTTMDLPADEPVTDRCGSCTRCIDACPTNALTPYELTASQCVSYLTIEHRGDVPAELKPGIGNWLYGCDICQDVCPFNRKPTPATTEKVRPRVPSGLDVESVLNWSVEEYQSAVRGTAIKRVKLPVLRRNAEIVSQNRRVDPSPIGRG